MSDGSEERRRFPRYAHPAIPVRLITSAFPESPLTPKEVSLEGFMVAEVSGRPEIGGLIDCSVEIEGRVFEGCQVRVAWMMENESGEAAWSVGLSLRKPEDRQEEIDAALKKVFRDLEGQS